MLLLSDFRREPLVVHGTETAPPVMGMTRGTGCARSSDGDGSGTATGQRRAGMDQERCNWPLADPIGQELVWVFVLQLSR